MAVVLLNGRPLGIPWIAENAPAILGARFPGTEGGNAIADVLLRLSEPRIRADGALKVGIDVQNTTGLAGDEVVQLYVRDLVSTVTRPVLELKGLSRVTRVAGSSSPWARSNSAILIAT